MSDAAVEVHQVANVFAVLEAASERNACGAVFFGCDHLGLGPWPLVALDYAVSALDELPEWLPRVSERVYSLSDRYRACEPQYGIIVEPDGVGQALRTALDEVGHGLVELVRPDIAVQTLQQRAGAAAIHIARGKVKLAAAAHERLSPFQGLTRNHLLARIVQYGLSVAAPETYELLTAWCTGILTFLSEPSE